MLLLALDTSTYQSSVALCSEERLHSEYTWYSGNNHSVELLCNIERIMAACEVSMPQLDALAVAIGPGSFNGVRVALTTAKSLSYALQKRLVGVSTLDTIAAQQQYWRGPVCAILEAGRSEVYAACYQFAEVRGDNGEVAYSMKQLSEYLLLTPQHLAVHLQEQANTWFGVPGEPQLPPFLFCGEISTASRQNLHAHLKEQCFFAGAVQSSRHASVLAMLALQRLRDGKEDDPLLLEPLYLRRPSITPSTRKQPLLGGTVQKSTGAITTEREEGALRH